MSFCSEIYVKVKVSASIPQNGKMLAFPLYSVHMWCLNLLLLFSQIIVSKLKAIKFGFALLIRTLSVVW